MPRGPHGGEPLSRATLTDEAIRLFHNSYEVAEEHWLWTRRTTSQGYGEFYLQDGMRQKVTAHRFSYVLHTADLTAGQVVRHRPPCDTKTCVNPEHLIGGTQKQNVEDRLSMTFGLSWDVVNEIRTAYTGGEDYETIETRVPRLSGQMIRRICRNKTWRDLSYNPGPRHAPSKFSAEYVRSLQERHTEGSSILQIASEDGISYSRAWELITGKRSHRLRE